MGNGRLVVLGTCLSLLALTVQTQHLEVRHWFPENPTLEFTAGKEVPVVFGVHNAGAQPLNVSFATASLAAGYDASVGVYNFSSQFLNDISLTTGVESSVEMKLAFPEQLPPREFFLKLHVYSAVDQQFFPTLVFNRTINVVEPSSLIDFQLFGLWIIFLAFAGFIGWLAMDWARGKGYVKKTRRTRVATTTGPTDRSDYLKGTAADPNRKRRNL